MENSLAMGRRRVDVHVEDLSPRRTSLREQYHLDPSPPVAIRRVVVAATNRFLSHQTQRAKICIPKPSIFGECSKATVESEDYPSR
jgi:hypothetical protein